MRVRSVSLKFASIQARSVVIATGARYRRLAVDRLDEFEGSSVHYWASPLEADLAANEEVTLVGGGNSAGQATVFLASRAYDPYPFILLNLAFSAQASYAAPLILMASNRTAQRDRLTLENDARETDAILGIQSTQVDLLEAIKADTALLRAIAKVVNATLPEAT